MPNAWPPLQHMLIEGKFTLNNSCLFLFNFVVIIYLFIIIKCVCYFLVLFLLIINYFAYVTSMVFTSRQLTMQVCLCLHKNTLCFKWSTNKQNTHQYKTSVNLIKCEVNDCKDIFHFRGISVMSNYYKLFTSVWSMC